MIKVTMSLAACALGALVATTATAAPPSSADAAQHQTLSRLLADTEWDSAGNAPAGVLTAAAPAADGSAAAKTRLARGFADTEWDAEGNAPDTGYVDKIAARDHRWVQQHFAATPKDGAR